MMKGKSLSELESEVERQAALKRDFRAPTKQLDLVVEPECAGGQLLAMTEKAWGAIAARTYDAALEAKRAEASAN